MLLYIRCFYIEVRISNLKLVEILKENSCTLFVKIAEKLKVSETAVRKKVRFMEIEGIIKKYTLEIYIEIIEKMKKRKEVQTLFSASGDHMILAECWFKTSKDLTKFVKSLEREKGTIKICPAVILEQII